MIPDKTKRNPMYTKNSKTNKQINNPKHKNEPKIEVKKDLKESD